METALGIVLILCTVITAFLLGYNVGKYKVYKAWSKWIDSMSEIMKK